MRWKDGIANLRDKKYRDSREFVTWVQDMSDRRLTLNTRKAYSLRRECTLYYYDSNSSVTTDTNKLMAKHIVRDEDTILKKLCDIEDKQIKNVVCDMQKSQGIFSDSNLFLERARGIYFECKKNVDGKWDNYDIEYKASLFMVYPDRFPEGQLKIDHSSLDIDKRSDEYRKVLTVVNLVNCMMETVWEMCSIIRPVETIRFDLKGVGKRKELVWPALF